MSIIGSTTFTKYLVEEGQEIYNLLNMKECKYLCVSKESEEWIEDVDVYSGLCVDCLVVAKTNGIPNNMGCFTLTVVDLIQRMLDNDKPVFLVRNAHVFDVRYPEPNLHREVHVFELEYVEREKPSYVALVYRGEQCPTVYVFDNYPYVIGTIGSIV